MTESKQSVVEPSNLANVLQRMNDVIGTFIALREQDDRDEQTSFWMRVFHEEAKAIASTLAELGLITKAEKVAVLKSIEWTESKAEARKIQEHNAVVIEASILFNQSLPSAISWEDQGLVIELQRLIKESALPERISIVINELVNRGMIGEKEQIHLHQQFAAGIDHTLIQKDRRIINLTEHGKIKLLDQIAKTGNTASLPLNKAFEGLVEVVTSQMNNPKRYLAFEPWYFAIGVAGTTCPTSLYEHETSDYEEICLSYYASDFVFELE